MANSFKPNVRVYDGCGAEVGKYIKEGNGDSAYYTDEYVWTMGGRVLFERELKEYGWTVKPMAKAA